MGWVWQRAEEKKDETNQKASFSPGLSLRGSDVFGHRPEPETIHSHLKKFLASRNLPKMEKCMARKSQNAAFGPSIFSLFVVAKLLNIPFFEADGCVGAARKKAGPPREMTGKREGEKEKEEEED